jgi:hypothetical protein
MRFASLLAAQCVCFGIAKSAPADDMGSLSASCENAAAVLDASLNTTIAMVSQDERSFPPSLSRTDECSEHIGPDPRSHVASRCIDSEPGDKRNTAALKFVLQHLIRARCTVLRRESILLSRSVSDLRSYFDICLRHLTHCSTSTAFERWLKRSSAAAVSSTKR